MAMEDLSVHFLYPAQIFTSKTPIRVNTILGSCVAVCLFDPYTKIGGINHYMLPYWNGQGLASPKYGNFAIEKLVEKMLSYGCNKSNLQAKIFGGGEVIEQKHQFFIGERNIQVAKEMLEEYHIPIIGSSVAGKQGRKIEFITSTGEVKQRYIQNYRNQRDTNL
jgi:chemotaxis protein CheD